MFAMNKNTFEQKEDSNKNYAIYQSIQITAHQNGHHKWTSTYYVSFWTHKRRTNRHYVACSRYI